MGIGHSNSQSNTVWLTIIHNFSLDEQVIIFKREKNAYNHIQAATEQTSLITTKLLALALT